MKYLLFSGSLRKDSLNKKLITATKNILSIDEPKTEIKKEITVADLKELNIPIYDGDVESIGFPEGVQQLGELIKKSDALIIASPEYNGSIAGPLKNCIDWVSRLRPNPFNEKPVLLMGASPGTFGAIRSLSTTRTPLENLNCYVYPKPFALPKAHEAFDSENKLINEDIRKKLTEILFNFEKFSERFKN
jgi:chromate reductase, NAD(P)H dehydrogenase (quinone)